MKNLKTIVPIVLSAFLMVTGGNAQAQEKKGFYVASKFDGKNTWVNKISDNPFPGATFIKSSTSKNKVKRRSKPSYATGIK